MLMLSLGTIFSRLNERLPATSDVPVSVADVVNILHRKKLGKTPGPDDI